MEKATNILFYSGNGNHPLAAKIIHHLEEYLGKDLHFSHIDFGEFPDEEPDASIPKFAEIKGQTVVFYQSIFEQKLFEEALELIWAIKKQYQASYLIAVIPFLIFRRQDHEEKPEEICRLKMAIDLLKQAGVDEMITVSPHSPQMAKFAAEFGLKMREVDPSPLLASTIKAYLPDHPIIYSPDKGSIPRAIELAKLTDSRVLFSLKERGLSNEVEIKTEEETEIAQIIARYSTKEFSAIDYADASKINGQPIVMTEDEADTGSTANKTGRRLKASGANNIIFLAIHPVLARGWRRKLFYENPFYKVILGDTIPRGYEKMTGGLIHDISVAELTAQALYKSLQPFLA